MSMSEKILLRAEVPSELGGQRLDQVAAQLFAEHSRSRLSAWIKDGRLTVDGAVIRPRDIVHGGAILELTAEQEAQGEWIAQDIALDIVYEDDDILVINKPAGLVVAATIAVQLGGGDPNYNEASISAMHPMNRLGRPEEVANAICWLLSDEASFVTGHILNVDGGFQAK